MAIFTVLLFTPPADGSTVMLSHDHTVSIIPLTIRNPGFDPSKDFVAVAGLGTFVNALALSGRAGVGSFNDYLASVRAAGAAFLARGNSRLARY